MPSTIEFKGTRTSWKTKRKNDLRELFPFAASSKYALLQILKKNMELLVEKTSSI